MRITGGQLIAVVVFVIILIAATGGIPGK